MLLNKKDVKKIQHWLHHRCMLSSEWPFSAELLLQSKQKQLVHSEPVLVYKKGIWKCVRCGNDKPSLFYSHFCYHCETTCTYCRHCIQMGKASSCKQFLVWTGDSLQYKRKETTCQWEGELSLHQKQASNRLVVAVEQRSQAHLIWAVCGAGKTEILFPMIEKSIELGFRIGIATPRTDVVKELSPRLKYAFPTVSQASLYGGSRDKNPLAQLVLATTHQLIRFSHAFDVLVIDEVDAFPYTYDASLQYASMRAKKPQATTIFLSATPSVKLRNTPNLIVTKIPRRFHGKPIPLPAFQWIGNWNRHLQKGTLPAKMMRWIQLHTDKPRLIFFPSIQTLKTCSMILNELELDHGSVYSEAPNRHPVIQAFKQKRLSLLLTTTILERGVTVENLQVAVLGAEQPIFDEACLVQIAGRVGRKQEFPDGDILYWHYGITASMLKAKHHIDKMNKEGML